MKDSKITRRKFLEKGTKVCATGVAAGLIGSRASDALGAEDIPLKKVIVNKKNEGAKKEQFGGMFRTVLISPSETGNNFLKLAYVKLPPGSKGAAHVHLGEEVVYTIQGKCILKIDGKDHLLEAGTAFAIPPEVPHPAEVIGDQDWICVAAYCDECPVLKKARNKQNVNYPVAVK